MNRVSNRLAAIQPSATLAITAKAKQLRAEGAPVIGFGAGEPNFATPQHIVEAAVAAAQDPVNHKYSPAAGLPELREAIAAKTLRDGGVAVSPSQIQVTNGGKMAVFEAFAALLDPGDEVLLPSPYWVTYPEAIRLAGGVPVVVPTDMSSGFKTTPGQLDQYVTERTKVFLFVSPSNPTGAVYTQAETEALGAWAGEKGLWALTDEIYEHLVYGSHSFTSLPRVSPALEDRWIIVNGVAKTYAMTGWRVGWLIGPQDVVKAATNFQSHATSNVDNIAQRAALAAVSGSLDDVVTMREAFDRRRQTMVAMLNEINGVECAEPNGAFYAFPSFAGTLGRPIGSTTPTTTLEAAAAILDEINVALVPGEAFGAPGYMRLSYALGDDDLAEGVARLATLLAG